MTMQSEQLNELLDEWAFDRWHLLPPKRERAPVTFENRPAKQGKLFIGADDLPGQTYLLDPFGDDATQSAN